MIIKKLKTLILKSVGYAIAMTGVGFIIKHFIMDTQSSLQDILFWIGAIPIAFFSIGFFGDFFGRGTVSYQLGRSVSDQSSNQRAVHDQKDTYSRFVSNLSWSIAGLLVWLASYFV